MNKRLFLKITTLGCEKHQHLGQKKKKSRKVWTQMKRESELEEGLRDTPSEQVQRSGRRGACRTDLGRTLSRADKVKMKQHLSDLQSIEEELRTLNVGREAGQKPWSSAGG